jgi:diguanylate cyclase (GGDEF)-like protein/PAS domain S-box-containing protein
VDAAPQSPARRPEDAVELGDLLAQLVEGRRWLRTVIDHLPAMVGYWDRDLRNRLANTAYVEWFGKAPEEIEGLHIREVIGEELYAQNLPYLEGALAGERQDFDRTIVDAQGVTRYSQAAYIPDIREDGSVAGLFVLVADVSDRVRTEIALLAEQARTRHLAEQLRLVSRLSASLHDLDPDTVQQQVTRAVLDLGYDGACVDHLDPEHGIARTRNGQGLLAPLDGVALPLAGSVSESAARSTGPVVVEDYQEHPQALAPVRATGVRTTVSVPVRSDGAVVALLHAGTAQRRTVPDSDLEVLSLLADIAGTALSHARRFEAARAHTEHLAHIAQTDALTGLGNRLAAERMLETVAAGDAVALVDLDGFKAVNDRYGHVVGDRVLRQLADVLRHGLRDHDRVARMGGEEFLLLLPETDLAQAEEVLHRLRAGWLDSEPRTTFSAGCTVVRPGEHSEQAYARADAALYRAKDAGRDQAVLEP